MAGALLLSLFALSGTQTALGEIELGEVHWLRDLDDAVAESRRVKEPIFLLFQEVPGCSTCQAFGENVLSHPLVVEAIEDLFVPVAIHNNKGGKDRETLELFGEPSWNNPVVRVVDAKKRALAPRLSGRYDVAGVTSTMVQALQKSRMVVPGYLRVLHEESSAKVAGLEQAVFAMSCFWSGEAHLGRADGVIGTRPGFLDGHEVVSLWFDPRQTSYATLVQHAESRRCAQRVFATSPDQLRTASALVGDAAVKKAGTIQPDSEPKYQLEQTYWRFVPMTELQAVRANSAVGARQDPARWMSPRQIALWNIIRSHPDAGWVNRIGTKDLVTAWAETLHRADGVRHSKGAVVDIRRETR